MKLEDVEELPDYMEIETIKEWFIKVFNYDEQCKYNYTTIEEVGYMLYELATRQWHKYELVDKSIDFKFEKWVKKAWQLRTIDLVDIILAIAKMLGSTGTFEFIKKTLDNEKDQQIVQTISSNFKEVEGHEDDPYWTLNKEH